MRFRKRPVIIEAVQFTDDAECLASLSELGLDPVKVSYKNPKQPVLLIETLEGTMEGRVGEYIIKGVSGEFYPCKPDIFVATYEQVEA